MQILSFLIMTIILVLSQFTGFAVQAQSDIPSACHVIPTKYANLESSWLWRDADTVIFSVSTGNGKNGLFPNPIIWYQYHPSTDQLEELKGDPYREISKVVPALNNLMDIQTDTEGSYRNVAISSTGDRFVYPLMGQNSGSYWYLDSKTGIKIDLGISARIIDIPLKTFWATTSQRFVVQGERSPTGYVPTKIFKIEGQKVSIQILTDLPPFSTYGEGFRLSNIKVMGISPDGQYLLIQPETMDNISWLYNLNTMQLSTINFMMLGEKVIWKDDNHFLALNDVGAIQYDIQKQSTQILIPSYQSKYLGVWSPDGRFLIGQYSPETGIVGRKNLICKVQ